MGLFASRDDKIKKYNDKIANYDQELSYKRILSDIEESIGNGVLNQTDTSLTAAYLIHCDLEKLTDELHQLNENLSKNN